MFKSIIIGLDGSDQSVTAARIGLDLVKHYKSNVTFVHVPHAETAAFVVGAVAGYHAATTKPGVEEIDKAGQEVLKAALDVAAEFGFDGAKTHMPHGDAATEILAVADGVDGSCIKRRRTAP